ncbi:TonB-dependent receptor [Stakelama sp. CBK3Z-3]|uniref:TonB-dependent receptor n=1 Tax=Stakelama flava TaxID=2860338 RepID=A0ABS6XKQ0_9SPHN|nr:TonB-dependent receptor [Stakelama flava]MBW4330783.1 TonB-dependent receptor [Stakelama flava]
MKVARTAASAVVITIALIQTTPAFAQDAKAPAATDAATKDQSSPPEAADVSSDEIVVTALRRDTTLERTPVAISAVSGAQLLSQGVTQASDLTNVLPNVENSVAGFAIRGVSSSDFLPKGDPATAFNLNGVYIARPAEQQLAMFDVDRVEVLRGPQGTLYGRNATAGVINVITTPPSKTFGGKLSAEYGNYNTVRLNGAVNAPLTDNLALRIAGTYNNHDGYTKTRDGTRAVDDQNNFGFRGSLRWDIAPGTDLLVIADYSKIDEAGPAFIASDRALAQNDDHSLRYALPGLDNYYKLEAGGISAELNSDLGFATLTYIGSYRKSDLDVLSSRNDITSTGQGDRAYSLHKHSQVTQELRLASTGSGPLQWVAGLYYFHEYEPYTDYLNFCCGFTATIGYNMVSKADTYAGFANATYSVLPGLRFTGGLRLTRDKKSRIGKTVFVPSALGGGLPYNELPAVDNMSIFEGQPVNNIAYYPGGDAPANKLTWKAQIEGDLTDDVVAYAKVETGYKAGGFNDGTADSTSAGAPFVYQPELITDYEAGVKGRVFDQALYFAFNIFHYDYKNHQVSAVSPSGGATTFNAPAAITGAELEGSLRIASTTHVDYSASILHTEYGNFVPGTLVGDDTNFKGQALDFSPKFNGRIALKQDFPLSNGGRITGQASLKYSSSYLVTDYIPSGGSIVRYRQDSYTRTDLSLGYYAPGDDWYIQGYAENLENTRRLGIVEIGGFTLTDPFQFGVRVGYNF